jgi:serine protease
MKKNIIILFLLFTTGAYLFGQQNYYWSAGKKQFLTEVENKFVVKLSLWCITQRHQICNK